MLRQSRVSRKCICAMTGSCGGGAGAGAGASASSTTGCRHSGHELCLRSHCEPQRQCSLCPHGSRMSRGPSPSAGEPGSSSAVKQMQHTAPSASGAAATSILPLQPAQAGGAQGCCAGDSDSRCSVSRSTPPSSSDSATVRGSTHSPRRGRGGLRRRRGAEQPLPITNVTGAACCTREFSTCAAA